MSCEEFQQSISALGEFWFAIGSIVCRYAPELGKGILVTMELTLSAIAIGCLVGLLLALGRVYGNKPVYGLCSGYVYIVRGTPLLVQLLLIYFGLPSFEVRLDAVTAAILGLGFNSAAYQAEYFRGAIQSIRAGQMQAALAIGMTRGQAIRHIILPQALRLVIPPWSNELIYTLKYSSAASFITVVELTQAGSFIAIKTFLHFEVYLIVAMIYLVLVLFLTKIVEKLEERLHIPGLGMKH